MVLVHDSCHGLFVNNLILSAPFNPPQKTTNYLLHAGSLLNRIVFLLDIVPKHVKNIGQTLNNSPLI